MILNTKKLAMLSLVLFAFASCMLTGFSQRPADDQPDMKIDAATRTQVIETLVKNLNDSYVFPDVAKQMGEAVRGRLQKGEYDQMTGAAAFAKALTEHLQAVSHDKHLRVRYSNEAIPAQSSNRREPSPEERQNMLRYYGTVNYGFEKIERMAGNIGYLDLRGFAVADMAGDTLAAAMNFVGNTEALIIDLRRMVEEIPQWSRFSVRTCSARNPFISTISTGARAIGLKSSGQKSRCRENGMKEKTYMS